MVRGGEEALRVYMAIKYFRIMSVILYREMEKATTRDLLEGRGRPFLPFVNRCLFPLAPYSFAHRFTGHSIHHFPPAQGIIGYPTM